MHDIILIQAQHHNSAEFFTLLYKALIFTKPIATYHKKCYNKFTGVQNHHLLKIIDCDLVQ